MGALAGFAQKFPLKRERLRLVLDAIDQNPNATFQEIAEHGGFNKPVAEGFIGWARHTGLICQNEHGHELTGVGQFIYAHDPLLVDINTLWLLHYHLCIEHKERSEAWYLFANKYAYPGLETTTEDFRVFFQQSTLDKSISKSAVENDPVLLMNCYFSQDALGQLGILRSLDSKSHYEIWKPLSPDISIRAFALFDFWQRQRNTTNTIPLDQLVTTAGGLGKVFFMSLEEVMATVFALASMGHLTYSDTQHKPVNRLFEGRPEEFLKTYYSGVA